MKLLLILLTLCVASHAECMDLSKMGTSSGTMEMRGQLRKKLLRDYDNLNIPDDVTCKIGMSLINVDLNKEKECMHTNVWMKLMWNDKRLSWDKSATSVDLLRLSQEEIWKPDITNFNSANFKEMMNCWSKAMPVVYSTGDVALITPCNLMSHCNMTMKENGHEHCHMTFGSWSFDKKMMKLEIMNPEVDLLHFEHRSFQIMSTKATVNERIYPGIPEPWQDVTFDIKMKKVTRREICMME